MFRCLLLDVVVSAPVVVVSAPVVVVSGPVVVVSGPVVRPKNRAAVPAVLPRYVIFTISIMLLVRLGHFISLRKDFNPIEGRFDLI